MFIFHFWTLGAILPWFKKINCVWHCNCIWIYNADILQNGGGTMVMCVFLRARENVRRISIGAIGSNHVRKMWPLSIGWQTTGPNDVHKMRFFYKLPYQKMALPKTPGTLNTQKCQLTNTQNGSCIPCQTTPNASFISNQQHWDEHCSDDS